jgi:quinol monooxygenase YgiN
MIVIAAHLDFADRASRDAAVEESIPVQQATRDEEPGCLAYCFAADPCNETRIQVYELWDGEATLVAHFRHPNYAAMVAALRRHGITGAGNRAFRTDRDEPVYGPDGQLKDAFFVD